MTPVTLKREFLGVDRQYRLVICPAAVGEHLTFQDCGNSKEDCDLSDDEGAVGQARKVSFAIDCRSSLIKIVPSITIPERTCPGSSWSEFSETASHATKDTFQETGTQAGR